MTGASSRLPDFLCLGAQRAGSTWLYELLLRHPRIYVPRRRKEVHYFDWYYHRGVDWYRRFFRDAEAGHLVAGEVTPDYLHVEVCPRRIADTVPGAKLVVMLRDPVERAISHYRLLVRDDGLRDGFGTVAREHPEILERGHYHRRLAAYLDHFPRNQLLLLVFERAVRHPETAIAALAEFLGVEPRLFGSEAAGARVNESFVPRAGAAYAAAIAVARFLHRIDLDGPVRLLRAAGARRLFGVRAEAAPVSGDERRSLQALYAGERESLRSLGVEVPEWGNGVPD